MKYKIRTHIKEKLNSHSELEKKQKSGIIKDKLFNEKAFKEAEVVMFYVSLKDEVSTLSMIDEAIKIGKRVCIPVIIKEEKRLIAGEIKDRAMDLERQHFGIYQPKAGHVKEVPLEDIDVIVVPGIAFDKKNVRLGRGHGYYDRFLCALPNDTKTIGIAFDFQVLEDLPKDSHDIPVWKTITA
ncbi:MAG: 5-formyltetrahydrofolate cyclo-ligase [Candidatus Omnitrophica bacterium]|nr:5-formyltetrahydrofolate cyclo-ligase [Candidatus Omnitrophota bacterium]